jgi:hypothetical protein
MFIIVIAVPHPYYLINLKAILGLFYNGKNILSGQYGPAKYNSKAWGFHLIVILAEDRHSVNS